MSRLRSARNNKYSRLVIVVPLIIVGLLYFSRAYGIELPDRSLLLSDSTQGSTASYQLSFDIPASETLGSISMQICANSPIEGDTCDVPTGFDITVATLSGQSGETGFSISPLTTANDLILTRTAATTTSSAVSYTLDGVINPSASGTYYGRVQTFASEDATGPQNEFGGLAFSINSTVQITATVPPYILFCSGITIAPFDCTTAAGDYINFGTLTAQAVKSAQSQMIVATNAGNGYSLSVGGTTMTSGNNVINALINPDVSRPGTSQFGLNIVANQDPAVGANPAGPGVAQPTAAYSQPNRYKFAPDDVLATSVTSDAYREYTVSYVVNIQNGQTPGIYVSTLTYVCLGSF